MCFLIDEKTVLLLGIASYNANMNPLDLTYCEKIFDALIAQPWNTYSNLAFVLVALVLWWRYQVHYLNDPLLKYTCLAPVLIFVGSSIWHATMLGWTLYFDVLPIGLFAGLFITYGVYKRMNRPLWVAMASVLAVVAVAGLTTKLTAEVIPQKSGGFIPLALILFGIGLKLADKGIAGAGYYYAAGLSMGLAIIARVADESVCNAMPMGTHWLWHALTALTAYLMVKPLIQKQI